MFLTVHELTVEDSTVGPLLATLAVLIVGLELSDVPTPVCMHVDAVSACLALAPKTFVAIAVDMNQPTRSTCQSILPEAFVTTAIWPQLDASAHPD